MEQKEVDGGCNMVTFTGRYINPAKMTPDDIDIQDIAHGLSNICRYAGQCTRFYSVAQHSRIMADIVYGVTKHKGMALTALLHDASEAYLCDLVRCVKALCPDYQKLEDHVQNAVILKFNLIVNQQNPATFLPSEVHKADMRMVVTERRQLISDQRRVWDLEKTYRPYSLTLKPEHPEIAKHGFLQSYAKYKL